MNRRASDDAIPYFVSGEDIMTSPVATSRVLNR